MKNILKKISYLVSEWNFKFRLFDLYFHDENCLWGFEFFTIQYDFKVYSALALIIKLPNENHDSIVIEDWDILFIERLLYNRWIKLNKLQETNKLNKLNGITYIILNKIFI